MATPRRTATDSTRLRARDCDRAAVCDVLDAAFGTGQLTEAELASRRDSAAEAGTLTELAALVRDLQVPRDLEDAIPTPPRQRNRRLIAVVAAAAVVVAGVLVVATDPWGHSVDADHTASSPDPAKLTTAAGLDRLLDEIQREFGDSTVDALDIYPEYALFKRAVPGKPGMSDSYQYEIDDGEAHFTESGTPSPRSNNGLPLDLAPLRPHVPTLIGLLYGADRTLAVPDPTSTHISIEQDEHGPTAEIYLGNDEQGTNGFLIAGFDGEVRKVRGAER